MFLCWNRSAETPIPQIDGHGMCIHLGYKFLQHLCKVNLDYKSICSMVLYHNIWLWGNNYTYTAIYLFIYVFMYLVLYTKV